SIKSPSVTGGKATRKENRSKTHVFFSFKQKKPHTRSKALERVCGEKVIESRKIHAIFKESIAIAGQSVKRMLKFHLGANAAAGTNQFQHIIFHTVLLPHKQNTTTYELLLKILS